MDVFQDPEQGMPHVQYIVFTFTKQIITGGAWLATGIQWSQNSNPSISDQPAEGKYQQKQGESPVS